MKESKLNKGLIDFLKNAPTPFHAVSHMADLLENGGFSRLYEEEPWNIADDSCYFITRNDSSLIAFTTGKAPLPDTGILMAGAHTDAPCLKIKPIPEIIKPPHLQLGVEVYGGPLLSTWFDRDLSIAGRVSWRSHDEKLNHTRIDFKKPVAILPSLAIHFDRSANDSKSINAQTDLPPILFCSSDNRLTNFQEILLAELRKTVRSTDKPDAILGYDLFLYDTNPPAITGLSGDFISGSRLDNLLSCYVGLTSFLHAEKKSPALVVFNDHEEVGSTTMAGAQGQFLLSVLNRLCPSPEAFSRTMARSIMVSIDNAHGFHPNHGGKFDPNHSPHINHGPVIKVNANQRYASTSETIAFFKHLCGKAKIPVQEFVMRSDMGCGTTIGPVTSAKLGVRTIDIGVPTYGMHSIRETAGAKDTLFLYQALQRFFSLPRSSFGRQP